MNHKKLLTQVIGYTMVFLLLVACGTTQPTSTPTDTPIPEAMATPTLIPTGAETEWIYVALGDSEPMCCGTRSYPEYYAEFIEQDLNVKVSLHNLAVSGIDSEGLLRRLERENYRDLISKAQVVTFVITMGHLLSCPQGYRECAENKLVTARVRGHAV